MYIHMYIDAYMYMEELSYMCIGRYTCSLHDLVAGVHDERALRRDGLVERLAAEDHELGVRGRGDEAERRPIALHQGDALGRDEPLLAGAADAELPGPHEDDAVVAVGHLQLDGGVRQVEVHVPQLDGGERLGNIIYYNTS